METTLVVFLEKMIVYMPVKFWDDQNLAIFGQIDSFKGFFGSPNVFRLRKEPINSLSYVR